MLSVTSGWWIIKDAKSGHFTTSFVQGRSQPYMMRSVVQLSASAFVRRVRILGDDRWHRWHFRYYKVNNVLYEFIFGISIMNHWHASCITAHEASRTEDSILHTFDIHERSAILVGSIRWSFVSTIYSSSNYTSRRDNKNYVPSHFLLFQWPSEGKKTGGVLLACSTTHWQ